LSSRVPIHRDEGSVLSDKLDKCRFLLALEGLVGMTNLSSHGTVSFDTLEGAD